MGTLRWAILGLDLIAEEFAANLNKHSQVYAIASTEKEKLYPFAQKHHIQKVYDRYDDLLNDPSIDIVYISTLGNHHYENIMGCLHHGKHVFCEKAIFSKASEITDACALAKQKNLFLGEAMTIYYMPLFKKIRQLVDNGTLGEIKMLRADFGSLKQVPPGNPLFSKQQCGGAMLDIGVYALTFVLNFMSAIPHRFSSIMNYHPSGVDELWSIVLKNENQELANINLSFQAKLPKRAIIAGDKAYIMIYDYNRADKAELIYPDGKVIEIHEGTSQDAVLYEIQGVEQAVLYHCYEDSRITTTKEVVMLMEKLMDAAQ